MTITVKLIIYLGFALSLISNFLLIGKIGEIESLNHEQQLDILSAQAAYRYITKCEFVPPAFNPPVYFITKDRKELGMNIKHVFKDASANAGSDEYQEKIDKIVSILNSQVRNYTLEELRGSKSQLEEAVINAYDSQTIESVEEFSILELCI